MISLSGGAVVYLLTQSFIKAALFSIVGIFIDIDHLFDYICGYGWKIVSFRKFSRIFYARKLKKIYVLLHSYELLTVFGFFVWHFKIEWGWIVFLSLAIHFLMDQIYYFSHFKNNSPWFYFLFYRISRGFVTERYRKSS